MSAGKESARDAVYGRRGGGWAPYGATDVVFDRPCDVCGEPMVGGQRDRHLTCCAAGGGLQRRKTPCNPMAFGDGVHGCAHCYLGGTPS